MARTWRSEFKSLEMSYMALKDDYSELGRALGFKGDAWFNDPLATHAEMVARAKELSRSTEPEAPMSWEEIIRRNQMLSGGRDRD